MLGGKTMNEKILTIEDIQTILRIGRNQAYKLVAEKKIRAFRTGKTWKITEKALEDYINSSEDNCYDKPDEVFGASAEPGERFHHNSIALGQSFQQLLKLGAITLCSGHLFVVDVIYAVLLEHIKLTVKVLMLG